MSAESNPPALEMRGVDVACLRRPELAVVENVDWTVAAADFWVVAGPQHSGKTDLLMVAAGLTFPARGTCQLFGRDNGREAKT